MGEPMRVCAVPGCSRPGYWEGVCTAHHEEAGRAYEIRLLELAERDQQIDAWIGKNEPIGAEEEEEGGGTVHISSVPASWQTQGGTPYGRTVLAKTVEKLALSANGVRNESLNRASYLIGGYVAGGEIAADLALRGLHLAAQSCGLPRREAEATIRSGFQKGLRKPVTAPAR